MVDVISKQAYVDFTTTPVLENYTKFGEIT